MKMVQFTRRGYVQPYDARLWLNPSQVVWVAASSIGHGANVEVYATIHGNGFCYDVAETPEEVLAALENEGARA